MAEVGVGGDEVRACFHRLRCNPDVVRRDGPPFLPQCGRNAAEPVSRIPGDWQQADVRIFEEGLECSGILFVAGAVPKAKQQLTYDDDDKSTSSELLTRSTTSSWPRRKAE